MKEVEQRKAAKAFAEKWNGIGDEKQDTHSFWIELFQKVYGVNEATDQFKFEYRVKREAVNGKRDTTVTYIDALLPKTHVLIEQKSITIDLDSAYEQSDKQGLTPFGQAMQYNAWLPVDLRAKWIVVCNFNEFRIHDLNDPTAPPVILKLSELEDKFHALDFLIDTSVEKVSVEEKISVRAGEIVGALYDRFLEQYPENERKSPEILKDINKLCVRIVFCLYAEDAGIFKYGQFRDYLNEARVETMHEDLQKLFITLNTPYEKRARFLSQSLKDFPYVNGGLFANEVEVPPFDETMRTFLLTDASEGFNWRDISPTIFGAVFESTLNPETRHQGGMHYTSIENIGKVIKPLFLDELKSELNEILKAGAKKSKLLDFQDKLARLNFMDPACGSGNFLTETFVQLRSLENQVIEELYGGQQSFDIEGLTAIKVSISQFHGIEINDFAISVAQTALWIAEHQMMQKVARFVREDFLPLHTKANLIEGNALAMDWSTIVPANRLNYIMGNPPFLGYSNQTPKQKSDILNVYVDEKGQPFKSSGKIDYVAGWFYKAAEMIQGSGIKVAFVSTNSIVQGEQVSSVWKPLFDLFGININFAWKTFVWNNDSTSKGMAHVHCVIVGFSQQGTKEKVLFSEDGQHKCKSINPYLTDSPVVFIENRSKPICEVPAMTTGNRPADGGFLILTEEEFEKITKKEPSCNKFIKRLMGADEFINNKKRYCLWLVNATPSEIKGMPEVKKRVEACRLDRLEGAEDRQKLAQTPHLFRETKNPKTFLIVPATSSENRSYIPIGFLTEDTIPTNAAVIIPNASEVHFGVLTSSVHMAWMRVVAGRLKSDYRYSKDIVYNNFVWPNLDAKHKQKIEKTAKAILDARALYSSDSMATLYDAVLMPVELRKAHLANDKAVLEAYGLKASASETEIVSHLMKLYVKKVAEVEKTEAVDSAVKKVIGKKAESVPEWMEDLRKQCLDGKITTDDLVVQGKARLKEEKKKAKEAEKSSKAKDISNN